MRKSRYTDQQIALALQQAEVKDLAIRQPSPEQERPDRNCDRAFPFPGARDRARTGDPLVGKEMRVLISLSFFA
jgi:hypothetical protein